MRAVLCKEWGGPEKLTVEDVSAPQIKAGAVRIAVHAAAADAGTFTHAADPRSR